MVIALAEERCERQDAQHKIFLHLRYKMDETVKKG